MVTEENDIAIRAICSKIFSVTSKTYFFSHEIKISILFKWLFFYFVCGLYLVHRVVSAYYDCIFCVGVDNEDR